MFPTNFKSTTRLLCAGLAGLIMSFSTIASAQGTVSLFKIITVKDDIVVGLAPSDIARLGGNDVSAVGKALAADGELSLWQFAVRKGSDGSLEQAPLRRVSIVGHDSLRVEPYSTTLKIVPVGMLPNQEQEGAKILRGCGMTQPTCR